MPLSGRATVFLLLFREDALLPDAFPREEVLLRRPDDDVAFPELFEVFLEPFLPDDDAMLYCLQHQFIK